jgi:lipopolysaccharide export system protein LptA
MKRLVLISFVAALAFAQTPARSDEVTVTADSVETNGATRHLAGHVRIETDQIVLNANDAEYNADTGQILVRGDSSIKLK